MRNAQPDRTAGITFAILDLRKDRIKNLYLSNSVCKTTKVKLVPASMLLVLSSMSSIFLASAHTVSLLNALQNSNERDHTHLSSQSVHDPIHELGWIGQQLGRDALRDPCFGEELEILLFLGIVVCGSAIGGIMRSRDRRQNVADVHGPCLDVQRGWVLRETRRVYSMTGYSNVMFRFAGPVGSARAALLILPRPCMRARKSNCLL